MSETKKGTKHDDVVDFLKDFSDLATENYNLGLNTALSLFEENQRLANSQLDYFLKAQKEYADEFVAAFERFPDETSKLWQGGFFNGNFSKITSAQREYADSVKKVSEKFTKETMNLVQKNAEKTLSVFESYASIFKS